MYDRSVLLCVSGWWCVQCTVPFLSVLGGVRSPVLWLYDMLSEMYVASTVVDMV